MRAPQEEERSETLAAGFFVREPRGPSRGQCRLHLRALRNVERHTRPLVVRPMTDKYLRPQERELRRLAGEATPGPWHVEYCQPVYDGDDGSYDIFDSLGRTATFVARCDPSSVLALLKEVGRLREALAEHAEADESMDPCDGNPCPLRPLLRDLDTEHK